MNAAKSPQRWQQTPSLAKARREVEEMRHIRLPFGQNIMSKVVKQFVPILSTSFNPDSDESRSILTKCNMTYAFFARRIGASPLEWLKSHCHVRMSMQKMLSSNDIGYEMEEEEAERWTADVYRYLQSTIALQSTPRHPGEMELWRTAIDVMYELIKFMNYSPCRQTGFHMYYGYLVALCKKACIPPSSFLVDPGDVQLVADARPGSGMTSKVFRCTLNGKTVAAKRFRISGTIRRREKQAFLKEAILLNLVPHPHILPFMGIVMTEDSLQILSLWMENSDILTFTKKNPNESKKELLEQVADGLDFLHGYEVVHSDLKSANILITQEKKACIADLGGARLASATMPAFPVFGGFMPRPHFQVQTTANTLPTNSSQMGSSAESSMTSTVSNVGTLRYMSPERLDPPRYSQSSAQATFASDVFSFGMLVYEVYAGKLPFSDVKNDIGLAMGIVDGKRPSRPRELQDDMWKLVQWCWHRLPQRRPRINDVYNILAVMA